MFLGKIFAAEWQVADEGAKVAAAAIATGAKVVGQIPVAMAHLENAADQSAEQGLEAGAKAGLAATKGAVVTVSDWKTWMDVKSAEVLQAAHVPVDPKAIQEAGNQRTDDLQHALTGAQKSVDATFAAMSSKVQQANAQRLKSAQALSAKISAAGVSAGKAVVSGVKAVGKGVEAGLKVVDGLMVDTLVEDVVVPFSAFEAAKGFVHGQEGR